MRGCLVAIGLLGALVGAQAEAKSVALIWKGAKTQADAEAHRAAWGNIETLLEKTKWELPEGHPKLVRSDTLAGLKPGFWVWLVGVCDTEGAATALAHLKVFAPDAYARDVEVEAMDQACPSTDGAPLVARKESLALNKKGQKLQVFTQEESQYLEPGEEFGDQFTLTRYHFVLLSKKGELLAAEEVVGEEDFSGDVRQGPTAYRCELEGIGRSGAESLVLTRNCRAGTAECGSVVRADEVTRVTVQGSTLVRGTTTRMNEQRLECGD
ncbi:hypothetical protein MYSTI_00414 [Myxococcus stipitatus DSM 14675]|uniref:Lipoprotein n=1 Tax=Myxococcus stipitatus (strain DSM 14675 / JCM 12634 / Mx s8) TaxID=1278073 RepID=L7TZ20_MYXSD|nr:hypothetical protein [Myxococcus stipitatus]AGC41766.1 hypothetical protein MYSTI_00414 [Myxococcus stipitatus DSM 14675]